jgi:hypothetical protein
VRGEEFRDWLEKVDNGSDFRYFTNVSWRIAYIPLIKSGNDRMTCIFTSKIRATMIPGEIPPRITLRNTEIRAKIADFHFPRERLEIAVDFVPDEIVMKRTGMVATVAETRIRN